MVGGGGAGAGAGAGGAAAPEEREVLGVVATFYVS